MRADDGAWKLETIITVTLVDENDNGPQFDREMYDFTVPFSKDNVSFVGKVQALDRDAPGRKFLKDFSIQQMFYNSC